MKALGIIFTNKYDIDLDELTVYRTMGAVPFAGRYRLIDFVLSNMVNSDIVNIGMITRKNYASLLKHVRAGMEWDLDRKKSGLTILPPFNLISSDNIYENRLEALEANCVYLRESNEKYVILSDTNYVGNIDYNKMLDYHIKTGAEITGFYTRKTRNNQIGVKNTCIAVDEDGRITDIQILSEKPDNMYVAINTWIMEREYLLDLMEKARMMGATSFRRDVVRPMLKDHKIMAYEHPGVILCLDNLSAYLQSNLDLLDEGIRNDLFHSENGPIITKTKDSAPTRYGFHAKVANSLIADDCLINGEVKNSIIFRGVRIEEGAHIENSVIMQESKIGHNARLNYAVLDKRSTINDDRMLSGYLTHPFYCGTKVTI